MRAKILFLTLFPLYFSGWAAHSQSLKQLDATSSNTRILTDAVDSTKVKNVSLSVGDIANGGNGFVTKTSLADSLLHYGILGATADSTLKSTYGTPWDITNGQYSGTTVSGKAHETLTLGQVCFMNSDGEYALAKADVVTTMPGYVMALATISANAYGLFLQYGYICVSAWTTVQTKGALVFVSETTAGLPDTTAPASTGEQVQPIGYCIGTDIMFFRPDWTIVEVP